MSDAPAPAFDFGKFIPGFDFLQKLASRPANASSPAPGLAGWVAPTVSVEELDRRIKDLKAVQFWLDQNAVAIKATIQALEVQKMTLATLQGMNLNMAEVAQAFALPAAPPPVQTATPASARTPVATPAPTSAPASAPAPAKAVRRAKARKRAARAVNKLAAAPQPKARQAPASAAAGADPMRWWGALTEQFQHIAANALREHASAAPPENATKSVASSARQTGARGRKSRKKPG